MNLDQFKQILKDYFTSIDVTEISKITYSRSSQPHDSFWIWLQKYLDELGISYIEFSMHEGEIIIWNYEYESILGEVGFYFPYKITLKDESKGFIPNNFKTIEVLVH